MNRTLTFGLSRSFGGTWNGFAKPQRLPIHQATIRKNQGLHVTPVPRVLKTSRFSPYRDLDFLAGSRGKDWRERTAGQDPISRNALSHKTVISHFEEPKVQTILRHTKNHMKGLEEKRPRVFNGNNVSKLFLRHEATWGPKIVGVARSQPRSSAPPVPCDTVAHPAAEPLREHCCALGEETSSSLVRSSLQKGEFSASTRAFLRGRAAQRSCGSGALLLPPGSFRTSSQPRGKFDPKWSVLQH